MSGTRHLRLAAVLGLLALLAAPALDGSGGRALGHAGLVASSPGAGAVVTESPPEIRLVFSEPLEAQVTSADVVAEDGTVLVDRGGEIDRNDPYALVLESPQLADGVYSLTWRTLSAADGHTAEGFFTFGVGDVSVADAAGAGDMTHSEAEPPRTLGRWLTYVGLLLAVGVAAFHRLVVRQGPMPMALVQLLAAGLGLSAAATLVAATGAALEAGSLPDYLVGTRNGALQLARATVAGLGAAGLLVVPRARAGGVAAGAGLAGIALLVASGHASALPGPVAVTAQFVHVAAAAMWIGGLAGLLALAVRPALMVEGRRPAMTAVVPRFSAIALVAIGLVSLTGVYSAWVQTGTLVTAETEYGRTLIAKSAIALVAFALGGLSYLDGGRMRTWLVQFRSRLTLEAAAVAAVLVATAVLASTPPQEEAAGVPIEPIPDAFGTVAPGMSMEIVPGRPGVNRFVVATTDALAAASALELGLERVDDGTTSSVPLTLHDAGEPSGGGHAGMATDAGSVDWVADAVVLPADSRWDTTVRVLSGTGNELTRQRFGFTVSETGIDEGRVASLITPAMGVAALLVVGGALGLGLGLGGMVLPRCDAAASRTSLVGGGAVAVALGALIGGARLLA